MTAGPATPPEAAPRRDLPVGLGWVGVGLLTVCGALAAWLESLYVPFYVGSVLLPFAVVLGLISNFAFPRLARVMVPTTPAATLPFLGWLAVILVAGVTGRPEGDVILPGGSGAPAYASYGLMLGGALLGTISIVFSMPPPASRASRRAPGP